MKIKFKNAFLRRFIYNYYLLLSGSRSSAWIEHWPSKTEGKVSQENRRLSGKSGVEGSNPSGSVYS